MRYLGRVHRVSVADLHERLGNPETKDNVDMVYTRRDNMSADIYTKCFTDKEKWIHACELINITTPEKLTTVIQRSAERFRNMHDPQTPAPTDANVSSKSCKKRPAAEGDNSDNAKPTDDTVTEDVDGVSTPQVRHDTASQDEATEPPAVSHSASKSRRRK